MSYYILKAIKFNNDKTQIKMHCASNNVTPKTYSWSAFMSLWEFLVSYTGWTIQYPLEKIWSAELTTLDELIYEFRDRHIKGDDSFYEMYYGSTPRKEECEKYAKEFFQEYFEKESKRYLVQYREVDKVSEVLWTQEKEKLLEFSINRDSFELAAPWYWMKLSYGQMKRLMNKKKAWKDFIVTELN